MSLKNAFACTIRSFNPFTNEFCRSIKEHEKPKDLRSFKSLDGRSICFLKLALSPFSIPLKIAKKIFLLVAAIFYFLAEVVHIKEGYFNRVGGRFVHVLDRAGSLVFSPLNIVVARIRFLLGLIHPAVVFPK